MARNIDDVRHQAEQIGELMSAFMERVREAIPAAVIQEAFEDCLERLEDNEDEDETHTHQLQRAAFEGFAMAFEAPVHERARRAAEIQYHSALLNELRLIEAWITRIINERTHTIEDFAKELRDREAECVDRVLRWSFSQSSSAAANITDMQKFKVQQRIASMFRELPRLFADDLELAADAIYRSGYCLRC